MHRVHGDVATDHRTGVVLTVPRGSGGGGGGGGGGGLEVSIHMCRSDSGGMSFVAYSAPRTVLDLSLRVTLLHRWQGRPIHSSTSHLDLSRFRH
jgi:hypothetical protein